MAKLANAFKHEADNEHVSSTQKCQTLSCAEMHLDAKTTYIALIICALICLSLISIFAKSDPISDGVKNKQGKDNSFHSETSENDEKHRKHNEQNCGYNEQQRKYRERSHVSEESLGNPNRPWFEVLEVSSSANLSEIKLAYKKKISGCHPDKVAGLAKEFRDLAEIRSKEINVAYAQAVTLRR